jgi:hypothetical protein
MRRGGKWGRRDVQTWGGPTAQRDAVLIRVSSARSLTSLVHARPAPPNARPSCSFLPLGYIPDWWRWFSYADFAAHIVRAITVDQFQCGDPTGATCPTVTVTTAAGTMTVPTYLFMQQQVGITYGDRWRELGIAAGIVGAIMAATMLLHRLNWQRR